jgi:hypothetical protein
VRSSRVLGHLQGNFREARDGRDDSERQERIDDAVTQISSLPALGAATKENELSSSNLLLTILPLKNTVRRGQTPHLGIW